MVRPVELPSGKWRARIWDAEKKRYLSLGTYDTEEGATKRQLLAEMGIDPDESKPAKPEAKVIRGAIRFDRFAEDLLWSRRHVMSRGTFENYQSKLRVHINPTFGAKRLRDITPTMVTRWFGNLPQTGTRRQIYIVLNMILSRAVTLGEIDDNPCKVEGTAKIKSPKKPPQHWADLRMLVAMAGDTQMRAMLWGLAGTGVRIGELLALDWQDLDLEGGTVLVDEHLTRFGVQEGMKAHGEKERTAVAFPEAVEAFRELQRERGGIQSGPVFLHSRGGRLTYSPAWDRFDALRKSLGLDIGFHHLRALHATTFAKHATIEQLQSQLGHDDIRSTLRYVASTAEGRKAVVEALSGSY